MSFTLPTFNLTCNIFTTTLGSPGSNTLRIQSACNLAVGKRVRIDHDQGAVTGGVLSPSALLLLPALTDIRDGSCGSNSDLVEVPDGSGRFYVVLAVDDIGKGFANEHRFAALTKLYGSAGSNVGHTALWPTPIP